MPSPFEFNGQQDGKSEPQQNSAKPIDLGHLFGTQQAAGDGTKHIPAPRNMHDYWTVVVDLGLVSKEKGPNGMVGSEEALHALELDLKSMPVQDTVNGQNPVRLVVGALVPHDASRSQYDFDVLQLKGNYLEILSSTPSEGFQNNFKKLTSFAEPRFNGEKMGLVINAHSDQYDGDFLGGVDGAQDKNGAPSKDTLSEMHADTFRQDVHDWVNHDALGFNKAAVGDRKLAFLDEQVCMGGKLANLDSVAKVADNLVASELIMHSGAIQSAAGQTFVLPGQSLSKIYGDVVNHPGDNGSQLSDRIIADADNHANEVTVDGVSFTAAASLGHYNLGAPRQALMQGLDQLGADLDTTLQKPAARAAIGAAIDKTPDIWKDDDEDFKFSREFARRDLTTFLGNLKAAVADHQIDDFGGHLTADISAVEKAQKEVVQKLHTSDLNKSWPHLELFDPSKLGGLSVSLPEKAVREDKDFRPDVYSSVVKNDAVNENPGAMPHWQTFLDHLKP